MSKALPVPKPLSGPPTHHVVDDAGTVIHVEWSREDAERDAKYERDYRRELQPDRHFFVKEIR